MPEDCWEPVCGCMEMMHREQPGTRSATTATSSRVDGKGVEHETGPRGCLQDNGNWDHWDKVKLYQQKGSDHSTRFCAKHHRFGAAGGEQSPRGHPQPSHSRMASLAVLGPPTEPAPLPRHEAGKPHVAKASRLAHQQANPGGERLESSTRVILSANLSITFKSKSILKVIF